MKIEYLQKRGCTAVWIGSDPGMVGVARKRPDDKYRPIVGLAVALLKAEFGGPNGQDRDAIMLEEPIKDETTSTRLSDSQVLVWADLRHEFRLALKSVHAKREIATAYQRAFSINYASNWMGPKPRENIPSDGQLCENFAIRLISEADLKIK